MEEKLTFRNSWHGLFFLLCLFLYNPYIYIHSGYLPLITFGALGLISAALLLFDCKSTVCTIWRMPKWMQISFAGFLVISLIHFFLARRISSGLLGEILLWLTVPLLSCVFYSFFKKYLSLAGTLFFAAAAFYSLCSWHRKVFDTGLTANVNWTAALWCMCGLLCIHFTYSICSNRKVRYVLMSLVTLIMLFFWIRIGSKGSILALSLCMILFIWLKSAVVWRKIIASLLLLVFFAGTSLLAVYTDEFGRFLMDDGRITFYESAISLIADHPVFGVGQANFEQEYMNHRVADYWFILNPAARSNHPHNQFLYIAGTSGIAGLIFWTMLLLIPLWNILRKLYKHEFVDNATVIFAFVLLYAVLHGSLDLILASWPTNILALLCSGLLWHEMLMKKEPIQMPKFLTIANILAVILLFAACLTAWRSCSAALFIRKLQMGELTRADALDGISKMIRYAPDEYQAQFTALNVLEKRLHAPELSLQVAEVMQQGNIPDYPGVHMGKGNAYIKLERYQEAIREYQAEARIMPFALRPVYNMVVAARMMKDFQSAAQYEAILRERMKIRQLDEKDLYKILTGKDTLDWRAGYKP